MAAAIRGKWNGFRRAVGAGALAIAALTTSTSRAQTPSAAAPPTVSPIPAPSPGSAARPTPPVPPPTVPGRVREEAVVESLLRPGSGATPPGHPPALGRPRPGSIFDPGAAGPGISRSGSEVFLDGALDPRTGWPFVFLDHFKPRPQRVEHFWVVQTRECPQEMGADPWPGLKVKHFDDQGDLVEWGPNALLAQVAGRPVLVQVQGSLTTPDSALGGLLWTHTWLEYNNALRPETVVIAFDWPSQRIYRFDPRDINEKGRRAYVAGYHLARFLQAFPPNCQISIIGQSYGGRVVPSALHLLGGGELNSQSHDPPVRLPTLRPDLQIRAIVIAGASDHFWLDPGERLDHALLGCQAFLNLYNRRDEALRLYPLLTRSGHHQALGKVGLRNSDFKRLGPLAARYAEYDVHDELGREHTLLDAVANPTIAQLMAPYLWNPCPAPPPTQTPTEALPRSRIRAFRER